MKKVFAVFVGGPWDKKWDYVPYCEYMDVIIPDDGLEHSYALNIFELPNGYILYFYISEDMDASEAMFRVMVSYTESPEFEE